MQIKRIKAENYKTYLHLDLDLSVTDDKPIILIGGMNGGGKTTLFDAIYSALYGLEMTTEREFRELFNAGIADYENKSIVLDVETIKSTIRKCLSASRMNCSDKSISYSMTYYLSGITL